MFSPHFASEEVKAQNGYVGISSRAGIQTEAVWPTEERC